MSVISVLGLIFVIFIHEEFQSSCVLLLYQAQNRALRNTSDVYMSDRFLRRFLCFRPRIRSAPLPLTHVSHIKSLLFSHRAGRVSLLFTGLDFCPVTLGLPRDPTSKTFKKLLQKMDMKPFYTSHVLQFRVQSQHKLLFQGQRECSYSLTVALQPD